MSYTDGMAALNLDAPPRIPRTEYSAERHWKLVEAVTGIAVDGQSSPEEQQAASSAFMSAWNYDLVWNICVNNEIFGEKRSEMGHAEYEAGGVDKSDRTSALFQDPEEALRIDFDALYGVPDTPGIVDRFQRDYRTRISLCPDAVNMTGIYVSCMSGLIEILGWDTLLCAAGLDPEGFGCLTERYGTWIVRYFEALAASDVPVVMVHDDIVWTSGAFIHPDWYRRFLFPTTRRLIRPLLDAGKKVLYTSDGTYTEFMDDIVQCGVHGLVMEPTTDLSLAAERYGKTHALIGNADTRVLLSGSRSEIEAEVRRCLDIGKNCPGYFMAVGNHIPANTPVQSALWYEECYLKYSRR